MSFYEDVEKALEGMVTIIFKNGDLICFEAEVLELWEVEP